MINKGRDIHNYEKVYMQSDFEEIQVKFRKKEVLKHFKYYNPKTILEIGCGMNPFFVENIEYEKYIVVEPSCKFVENAQKLKKDRVEIYQEFLEDFIENNSNSKFDFIILSSLLHEVKNPAIFLEKLKLLCTKNTVIHINVPNSKSMHRILAYEMGIISKLTEFSQNNINLQQNTIFDMNLLVELIEKNGFLSIEQGSYFLKPFSHSQMLQILQNDIIDESVLDGFYNIIKYFPEYGSEIFINMKLK